MVESELEQLEHEAQLEFDACLYIATRYLMAQGWALVDATTLVERFWPDLQGKGLKGRQAREAIENAVWLNYAAVVYDWCRQPDQAQAVQAWAELQRWLERQARAEMSHPQEREEVVQEAMISLHETFEGAGLKAPRALWAFAVRALRNARTSRHRWRSAQKRDERKTESLEENEARRDSAPSRQRPIGAPPGALPLRPLEDKVINRDRRRQLETFLEQHLSSDLQLAVAKAVFLENQTPAEIAALLQKSPHEVRMIKSRALQILRNLPQPEIDRLLAILDAPPTREDEDDAADG